MDSHVWKCLTYGLTRVNTWVACEALCSFLEQCGAGSPHLKRRTSKEGDPNGSPSFSFARESTPRWDSDPHLGLAKLLLSLLSYGGIDNSMSREVGVGQFGFFQPFFPPSRPKATAAGFFPSSGSGSGSSLVADSTVAAAIWFRSRGLPDRLGIISPCAGRKAPNKTGNG